MATKQSDQKFEQLKAENSKLRAQNEQLQQRLAKLETKNLRLPNRHKWRSFGAICFITLAVLLVVIGNLLFWTGNTLVKTNRFTEAVSPVIQNSAVDSALANYTTNQIYSNVDVTKYINQALPPRASFLAPTIANSLKSSTQSALNHVLSSPNFHTRWNTLLANAHTKFINTLKQNASSDGTIDINQVYQQLSQSLQSTRLSFLANRKLPSKVGDITVLHGEWISIGHTVIVNISLWRVLAIILFLIFSGLGIYLSLRRRRAVVTLALASAGGLLLSLIAIRVTRESIADQVNPAYSDAVRQTVQIIFHPLVVQTVTLLSLFVVVAIVAWVSGQTRSAMFLRDRVALLANGKLHPALFGGRENSFTLWLGKYKRYLEWGFVALMALLALFTRLTPTALIIYIILIVIFVLLVEVLAASKG